MNIKTLSLKQEHQYQQNHSFKRNLSKLTTTQLGQVKAERASNNAAIRAPTLTITINRIEQLNSSTFKPIDPVEQQAKFEEVYQRPLSIEMKAIKLILERFYQLDIAISESIFDRPLSDSTPENQTPTNNSAVANFSNSQEQFTDQLVTIDNQRFANNDIIKVEQWQSHSQSLSFQMQGEFEIDGVARQLSYEFSLESEYTSYQSFESSAAALKDPILVQFGSRGLGEIVDQTSFDINQDNKLDDLPIFSGDVGYLVFDLNNNGKADNGQELFGPQSGNGFNEMQLLDSNENGFLDVDDEHYHQLYLWQPGTGSQSQTEGNGQWLSLAEADISAINLNAQASPFSFYDNQGEIQAQLRQSSFAITGSGHAVGVHQVDIRI